MSQSRPPMSSLSIGILQDARGEASRQDWTRGPYLRAQSRGGQQIPIAAGVVLERGDLHQIVGPEPVVERAAEEIGTIIAPSSSIDFVVLGLAIFVGSVIGVPPRLPSETSRSP